MIGTINTFGTCAWCHNAIPLTDWRAACDGCGRESELQVVRGAVDAVWRDPDWLRRVLVERKRSTRQAAAEAATSAQTISRWARKLGVKDGH